MLIIDPLQAYLGANTDMHRANEIRPIMHELSNIAERTECAIVLICHMNKVKNGDTKGLYRVLGSIDIPAAARSVLLLGRNPDNKYIRIVIPIKSSLAPEGKAITFELNPDSGFMWLGESELTAKDILVDSKKDTAKESKLEKAKKCILSLISEGDILVSEATDILIDEGISEKTIERARKELKEKSKIETYHKGFKSPEYYWRMPKKDS